MYVIGKYLPTEHGGQNKYSSLIIQITKRGILYPPAAAQKISVTRALPLIIFAPDVVFIFPGRFKRKWEYLHKNNLDWFPL